MRTLRLTKHQGQGNDFLILLDPENEQCLDPSAVRYLCDRHAGVGADGVIRVTRADPGDDGATLFMELRNADGGIAEMSGNGVRCLAQAAVDAGLVSESTLVVRTLAGPRRVKIVPGEEYGTADVSVDMGAAQLGAGEADQRLADVFPGSGGRARTVCMGNPHLVILLPDLLGVDLARAGAAAQDVYDGGINVELIAPAPISDELVMRVWERGVGETLACGTGSCAAAAAAREWGVVGDRVRVHNPGGTLDVGLNGSRASLSGLVRRVCAVEVEVP